VSGDLVEDQRQGEGDFLVLEADVAVENRAVTDVRGGLLDDDAAVGFDLRVASPLIVAGCAKRPLRGGAGVASLPPLLHRRPLAALRPLPISPP
jgi:hypothetical protein